MPKGTRGGARALLTGLVLLLATFLGVECAAAQVTADTFRPAASASVYTAVPGERSGAAEDDCKPRHGPRRSASAQAHAKASARVCDCDVRTVPAHRIARPVTVREGARRVRSVDLPLLHQTFRC